ncbi:MAG: TIM barrel protein [Crocinitomicaceae bacterium]
MSYISSSCLKNKKIIDSINELVEFGFDAIELSGGTRPYAEMETDLIQAEKNLGVKFLLHNYFPPPQEDFVLNLASSNDTIRSMSLEHIKRSIDLSIKLDTKKFAFHAGFLMDIKVEEIGKKITNTKLSDKSKSYDTFCEAYTELIAFAGKDIKLYIENNVFSKSNHESFKGINPLMLTDLNSYKELKSYIDFNLLLDVAHLKVSANTLNLDFDRELIELFNKTDYIHVSDNDGKHDTNSAFKKESTLYKQLDLLDWSNKTVTIEVYDSLGNVKSSMDNINKIINA